MAPAGHPDRRVFANLIVRKNDLGGAIRSAVAEEQFPPGAGRGAPGLHPSHGPFSSWYVHILPFIEDDAIWQQIDFVNLPPEPVIGDVPWSVGNTVLSTGKKVECDHGRLGAMSQRRVHAARGGHYPRSDGRG